VANLGPLFMIRRPKRKNIINFHIYCEFDGWSEAVEEVKKLLQSCWSMWPNHESVIYRKPTHTGRYLYFKPNHPYQVKSEVVHSSISRVKVIRQDNKDFNKETKNIRHDLLLNDCPQEFVDTIMKPSRSNRPSDRIYQGTFIIPNVKGISEKLGCIGNRFNVRTIFQINIHSVGH
jgi:hypothetical protein